MTTFEYGIVFDSDRAYPYELNWADEHLRRWSEIQYWREQGLSVRVWHKTAFSATDWERELDSCDNPFLLFMWGAGGKSFNDARGVFENLQTLQTLSRKVIAVIPIAHPEPSKREWAMLFAWLDNVLRNGICSSSSDGFKEDLIKKAEADTAVADLFGLPSFELRIRELAALELTGRFLETKPDLKFTTDPARHIYAMPWSADIADVAAKALASLMATLSNSE